MVHIDRDSDLAEVGANGAAWVAAAGSTAPATPLTQPAAPWLPVGAISDNGLVQGFNETSQEFTPWGLTSPFRTQITKSLRTFKFTAWETTRVVVQSLQYRLPLTALAPASGSTTFAETASPTPDRRAFYLLVLDGDNISRSLYVPQGEITDRSDVTHKQDSMAGFEWTITAYPDSAGNTVYHADMIPATPAYTGS